MSPAVSADAEGLRTAANGLPGVTRRLDAIKRDIYVEISLSADPADGGRAFEINWTRPAGRRPRRDRAIPPRLATARRVDFAADCRQPGRRGGHLSFDGRGVALPGPLPTTSTKPRLSRRVLHFKHPRWPRAGCPHVVAGPSRCEMFEEVRGALVSSNAYVEEPVKPWEPRSRRHWTCCFMGCEVLRTVRLGALDERDAYGIAGWPL